MNKKSLPHPFKPTPKAGSPSSALGYSWRWAGLGVILFAAFWVVKKPVPVKEVPVESAVHQARWEQMCQMIDDLVLEYDGDVGVYIKDLRTGRVYEKHADAPFVSASLIKLPIMAATFQAIHQGKITLQSRMQYRRAFRREGSGTLKWSRSGATYQLSQLVYAMITKSDNTATAMIIHLLGYEFLNRSFDQFGLRMTRIVPTGMSLADTLHPSKDNYTTAREMGTFLEKIYRHELISDGLSDLMLEIMKGANSRSRLAEYLPKNWKLARKTGLLRKNCHDVGIVFAPEGDYVICVLTGHNGDYRRAKGLIASVGREAYQYMGSS